MYYFYYDCEIIYIINIVIIMFVNGVKNVLPHLFCVPGLLSNERSVPHV